MRRTIDRKKRRTSCSTNRNTRRDQRPTVRPASLSPRACDRTHQTKMEPSPDARSSHHEARNRASTQTAIGVAKGRLTACPKSLVATARGPSSHRNVAPIAPLATIHACTQLAVPSIHPYDTARQDYFLAQLSLCTSTAKSFGAQNVGQSRPSSSS